MDASRELLTPAPQPSPASGRGGDVPHWSAGYVGLPYVKDEFDCAGLVERVLSEVFGWELNLPKERAADLAGLSAQILDSQKDFALPVDPPLEGDGVLMVGRGRINHVGVYCEIGGEGWVLHNMRRAGQVCLHRVREIDRYGLSVEGYYRWI